MCVCHVYFETVYLCILIKHEKRKRRFPTRQTGRLFVFILRKDIRTLNTNDEI